MRGRIRLGILVLMFVTTTPSLALQLTWNELNDETYGAAVGARVFAETLESVSGGEMGIDLYFNGALGSEKESLQGLQMGTLDIFRGNASSLTDYGAELIGATGLPYLFADMEDFEAMAESPLGKALLDSVAASDCGFVALAWLVEGPRNLFITEDAYQAMGAPEAVTLDMMKGLNIRVPGTQVLADTIQALGAQPIEVAYSELLPSLRSGNIDGAENGIISYISQGFSEAAPYFIDDAHMFGCGVVLVSSAVWNDLTPTQQDWMQKAGAAASEVCYRYNLEEEQKYYEQFAERGIRALPVADIENWQAACAPIYESQSEAVQAEIRRIQAEQYD